MPVIGFLNSASPDPYVPRVKAFHQGLKETGYVEGQNVAIEYRWAEKSESRDCRTLAAELAHRPVSVIAAGGQPRFGIGRESRRTTTIPIVFMNAADPVAIGLVASFHRPGGNVTGITLLSAELVAKRLGILRDLLPSVKKNCDARKSDPSRSRYTEGHRLQEARSGTQVISPHLRRYQRTRL